MNTRLPAALFNQRAMELQRQSLFYFLWTVFDILHEDKNKPFVPNWHLRAMAFQLSRVAAGDERHFLITMPPRHLKTITTSVAFVAWLIGRDPGLSIIMASYAQKISSDNLYDLRRVIEDKRYKRLFPNVSVQASGNELFTAQGGQIFATSVGGSITGVGADYIIADDLLKASDALSPVERDKAFHFYQHSLITRFNDKSQGRIVLVQQRLHADDVAGRLLEAGGFSHLCLPAIAEEEQTLQIGPNEFHRRNVGDVLFPQTEPREVLDDLRRIMGSDVFVPQYQQRTDGAGSDLFQWSWFETYSREPDRDEFNMVIQSVDTAFADGADSDWSVCLTLGRKGEDWYILDVHRTRDSYSDFRASVARLIRRWNADRIIIEHAGTGITLRRELLREDRIRGKLEPYKPRLSKTERFNTQIERVKTTRFLLPTDVPWLAEFRREITSFPNGRHDDQVDALTQFLDWLGHRRAIARMRDADEGGRRRR